jgi:hypothetical protein
MEAVIVNVLKSQLKAYPPKSPIDVIRTAKMLIQDMKVDVSIINVLEIVARGQDGIEGTPDDVIPPVIMKGIRVLLNEDMIHDIANELGHVKAPKEGCFCF